MQNERIRGDNIPQKQGGTPDKSHLFIADNDTQTVEAVSDVDKGGKLKTVPAKKNNLPHFLEIGHNSDAIDLVATALKNFVRQADNPSRYHLFRMPSGLIAKIEDGIKETVGNFQEILSGMFTREADEYRVVPDDLRKTANHSNSNNLNEKEMAKKNQTQDQEPTPRTRILPGMVDWNFLRQMGLSKELLENKGFLTDMLQGRKSPDTMFLNINLGKMIFQGEAKISLQKQKNETYGIRLHPIKRSPEFEKEFHGHIFTEEDKKNLLTTGNMGRVVDLIGQDFQNVPSVISLDRTTNELHFMATEYIYIPDDIAGIKLQKHEIETLKEGGEVFIEGFKSRVGKEFDATLQVDAVNRRLSFRFDNEPGEYKKINGVELSEQDQKNLLEGGVVRVEDMKSKNAGELWDAFAKLDLVTNRVKLTSYNPESPEGAREIIVPKYIGGVKLEADDRKELGRGAVVFIEGMVDRNNNPNEKFVKLHAESGKVLMSRFPDGFEEHQKPSLHIPEEVMGVKITAKMRAELQDGKTVHIKGAIGTDSQPLPLWMKANKSKTGLNSFHIDPDEKKSQTQTTVIARKPEQEETKRKTGQKM